MAATLGTIEAWFKEAEKEGASHMLVVCDTYDFEDYPVWIWPGDDPSDYKPGSMQKIMECYKISLGWESQSKERRAFHWEMD